MPYTQEYIIKYTRDNKKKKIDHLPINSLINIINRLKDVTIQSIIKKFKHTEDDKKSIIYNLYDNTVKTDSIELLDYLRTREKIRNIKLVDDHDINLIKQYNDENKSTIYITI
jgi:hypothetical protein